MIVQGKVIQVNPTQTGESPRGTWKKKEFILETNAKIPKKICMVLKGDSVDTIQVNSGDEIKAHIDIESREFKERWYTEVRAWKIEPASAQDSPSNEDYPF